MSLAKCRDCSQEVSTDAAFCQKCGRPIKKKTSPLAIGCLGFLGLCLLVTVVGQISRKGEPRKSESTPARALWHERTSDPSSPAVAEHEAAPAPPVPDWKRDLQLVRFNWRKGGFDSVALLTLTIRNTSKVTSYRDIRYVAGYGGASGTATNSFTGTVYEIVKPGKTRTFRDLNNGFVNEQAVQAAVGLAGATAQ